MKSEKLRREDAEAGILKYLTKIKDFLEIISFNWILSFKSFSGKEIPFRS
jgi:hypothetical protein